MVTKITTENHPDVELEIYDIVREKKSSSQAILIAWPLALLGNALLISIILVFVRWIFNDADKVFAVGVTCTGYICAVLGAGIERIRVRLNRMEMHALTLHSKILDVEELQVASNKRQYST